MIDLIKGLLFIEKPPHCEVAMISGLDPNNN